MHHGIARFDRFFTVVFSDSGRAVKIAVIVSHYLQKTPLAQALKVRGCLELKKLIIWEKLLE